MTTITTREEKGLGKVRADQLGPRRSIAQGLLARALRWGAYILLWVFALLIIYPLFWMITASFKTNPEMFSQAWALPQHWQWSNWSQAWQLGVAQYVLNSVIVTVGSIIGVTVLGAWAAYSLSRFKYPLRTPIFYLLIGGLMLSPQVALIPLFRLLSALHIYNTLGALILLDIAFRIPFTVFLMRAYMLGLPYELEEAAYMDGANHWQIFWHVIVPLSRPIMLSAALLQAFFSWNEFLFALTFIQDSSLKTLPVGLLDMQSRLLTNWPVLLAALSIAALPMIALFIIGQRWFVRGLAEGIGK